MKSRTATLLMLSLADLTLPVSALAGTADIQASNNQVSVQAISTHVDYTETGNGLFGSPTGTLDTEKGNVRGYRLSASVMKDLLLGNDYIQAQYSRVSGHTTYTGQSVFGGGGFGSVVDQSGAKIVDYSLRYGKGFVINDQATLTPFFEIGRHRWERGVNEGETYTNGWYGLGIIGQYSPAPQWVLGANALLGRINNSNINVAGPLGFSAPLGNSDLYRYGLAADYAFTRRFHGNIGVDYTSFKYGISSVRVVGGGAFLAWEPASKTKYTTVNLGLGYAF